MCKKFSMLISVSLLIFLQYLNADSSGETLLHIFFDCPEYRQAKYHIWGPVLSALEKNPIKHKVNCFMVPWNILRTKGKVLEAISSLKAIDLHFDGGFTIIDYLCKNSYGTQILDFLDEIGINVVFTPLATKIATKTTFGPQYKSISIEPFPYVPYNGTKPAEIKDIYYSFIGAVTHTIRRELFKTEGLYLQNTVIIERPSFMFISGLNEYKNILARSRFSICPRGEQPHCLRFFESLQAGAIPILIADDIRLPENFEWKRCAIRVKESQLAKIPEILADISIEEERLMREGCYEAYELFSQDNLLSVIGDYYEKLLKIKYS